MTDNNNRILITGSAGLLGQSLLCSFSPHFDIIATYYSTQPDSDINVMEKIYADLADPQQSRDLVFEFAPDIILNSAAWVDVDGCESDRERARRSNFEVVRNLVDCLGEEQPLFIQISTDYIFNGKDHPGKINDPADPLNYYGETKLLAEEYLKENYTNYLIARTCALIAPPGEGKTNLINYFYDKLSTGEKVSTPDDLHANPILIDHLAELLLEAAQKRMTGVIHLGGLEYMSRYDIALLFAEVFGFDPNLVKAVSAEKQNRPALRPKFAGLDIDGTVSRFETPFMPLRQALKQIKTTIEQ